MEKPAESLPPFDQGARELTNQLRCERDTADTADYIAMLRDRFSDSEISHRLTRAGELLKGLVPSFDRIGFNAGCALGLRVLDELLAPSAFNRLARKLEALVREEQQFVVDNYPRSMHNEALLHGLLGYAAEGFDDMAPYAEIVYDPEMVVLLGPAYIYGAEEGFGLVMALRREVLKDLEAEERAAHRRANRAQN